MFELNKVYLGDSVEIMQQWPDSCIDLVVTSPPYDNLRTYGGHSWNFEETARELSRILKPGGIIVWVVGDATIEGSETLSSFKQAIYFKDTCGLNAHDTMIWNKGGFTAVGTLKSRYGSVFEYMFIFSKGKIKTFNPLKDRKNKTVGGKTHGTIRQVDGTTKSVSNESVRLEYGQRFNIWEMANPGIAGNKHPATFPLKLARDHILSWSNEGDIVLDCFAGSGTTLLAAKELNRKYVGIEINSEYIDIITQKLL